MGSPDQQACYTEKHTTAFYQHNMDQLKAMLAGADAEKVQTVANNWKWINEKLVGGEDGGLKKQFDDAVEEVLEHWSGAAAEGFRKRARKISESIADAAPYALNTYNAMNGAAAALRYYKQQLNSIEKPSAVESGLDSAGNKIVGALTFGAAGGRDDSKADAELARGVPAADVLNGNAMELSEGKERQLQCAAVMEYLGAAYRSNAKAIPPRVPPRFDDEVAPPIPDNSTSIPPVIPTPVGMNKPTPKKVGPTAPLGDGPGYVYPNLPTTPNPDGITGGVTQPVGTAPKPMPTTPNPSQIGTGLDGISTGPSGIGGGPGGGGLGVTPGVGTQSGGGPGTGNIGMPGAPGGLGGARSGTGTGSGGSRRGMPGMGGAPGAGAGTAGRSGSGRGSLARQRGGVVGAARGKSGAANQGGSGLHRSRGGTQAGAGRGMMGMPGARGANGEEKGREGKRPDYLVEDEETWMPERNVAPKVIE